MRHIGTLIAAIFIGPLAWILIAFGQDRSAAAFAKAQSSGAFHTGDFVRPLVYLAAAGVLVGLIATLRFSPLGAVLTGLVYVLSYVWLLIDPKALLNLFDRDLSIFGQTADPRLPVQTGTTLIVGALLLVAVVSVNRWRRWPRPVAPAATDEPVATEPAGTDAFGLGPGDLSIFQATPLGSTPPRPLDTETPTATAETQATTIDTPTATTETQARERPEAGTGPDPLASSPSPVPARPAPAPRPEPVAEPAAAPVATAPVAHRATPPGSPWATPLRANSEDQAR